MAAYKNELSWSKTRDESFNECKRKYFLHYYLSWGGWYDSALPRKREVYIMKKLSSRPMWIGKMVHKWISIIIKTLNSGRTIVCDQAISDLREEMLEEWKNSINNNYRNRPSKITGLFDHYYHVPTDMSDFESDFEKASIYLANFYKSIAYQELQEYCPLPYNDSEIEQIQSFDLDRIKVWVSIDLAYKTNGISQIIDWKTGNKSNNKEIQLQLTTYSLYLSRKWDLDNYSINLREVNLRYRTENAWRANDEGVAWAIQYIKNSYSCMEQYLSDPLQNIPLEEEYFPKKDNQQGCNWCNFLGDCHKDTSFQTV